MQKLVSIVIPVYNTPENYLQACFASVLCQEYPSIEVVVVDDGSDAATAQFIERACAGGFKLVRKLNGGLSDARNFGVANSQGEYIYFLDSDDELASADSITALVATAEKADADMVVGEYHYSGNPGEPQRAMAGQTWLIEALKSDLSFSAADQLYSRALLSRMDSLFRVGLVHEDEEFTPRALMAAGTVVGLPGKRTYVRSERDGSITKSVSVKSCFKRCEGKLIVARDSLADDRFASDPILRSLMDERAFFFANMAFRSWATSLMGTEYEEELQELAGQIDYSRARFSRRNARCLRNWACMRFIRLFDVGRYVNLLGRMFGRSGQAA